MPQIDIDGANSKISADKIQGQSGTTVTVPTGHTVAITDSGGLTLAGTAVNAQTLVASTTVSGSAVTSISFTGLDLDTHLSYLIEVETLGASNDPFSIYANNLQTATDYRSQLHNGTSIRVDG